MSNVRLFPIKFIPLTEEAEAVSEEYYGYPLSYLASTILSFLQLNKSILPIPIKKLISLTLKNKKLTVAQFDQDHWDHHQNLSETITEFATWRAFHEHLNENINDPKLFSLYNKYEKDGGWFTVHKYITAAFPVNFIESGIFEVVKVLWNDGFLTEVTGVDEWLRKTSIRLQKQWMEPRRQIARPPISSAQNGGQKT